MPCLIKRLFTLCILIMSSSLFSQALQFRHYTVNDGLANTTVYYVMQDSKGYLWFCTESGVNRFDGKKFETFTIKDGLADNENFRCLEDKKGRIWFSSYNGKLCYYDGKRFVNEKQEPGLAYITGMNRYIKTMEDDEHGNIWFNLYLCDTDYIYDGKKVRHQPSKNSNGFLFNKVFFNWHHHFSVIKLTRQAVYRENLDDGSIYKIMPEDTLDMIANPCIFTDSSRVYFHTYKGLKHICHDTLFSDIIPSDLGLNVNQNIVYFKFSGNDLWLGAALGGLFFIPDFKTRGFTGRFQHYLNKMTISSIEQDDEGGTWITSLSEGVFYLPRSAAYVTLIPGESFTSLKHSPYNNLLATGTYYGAISIDSMGKTIQRLSMPVLYAIRIKGFRWLSDKRLLVGLEKRPFYLDLTTMQQKIICTEKDPELGFSDMDESKYGIWLEGREAIFLVPPNGQMFLIYSRPFLYSEKLVSIAHSDTMGCWFNTVRELFWLDAGEKKATRLAGPEVFASNLKDLLYYNGLLWVATDGNGIFIFKNGKLYKHLFSANTTLISDICQKLMYDGHEQVWIATNKGISVLNAYTFEPTLSLTSNDALINNDIKDLDLCNGKAYVATPSGISVIDINKFIAQTKPPKVYVRALVSRGKNYAGVDVPQFQYLRGAVALYYNAITFQSHAALMYRYKLNNSDSWHETNLDQVEFYDLQPGEYSFRVSAKKYNSDWSAPVTQHFVILPLWYQSRWFAVTLLLCVIVIVYLAVKRIINNNRKKNETERKMLESELKAIRLHMNPHFIFNTLNSLQLFIFKNQSQEANTYIAKFARLIRWIMSYSDKQEISLGEELEFLKTYVELEQLRFDVPFRFLLKTDSALDAETTYIPALVIQPFVENAIKYGLAGKKEGGELLVSFEKKEGFILAIVQDNGVGRDRVRAEQEASPKEKESTGISYTEERLRLLTGNIALPQPVTIIDLFENKTPAGTRVELIIPMLK